MLLSAGVPIATVSQRLGHSKVSTTLDSYAHVLPESRGTVGARFDARLRDYGEDRDLSKGFSEKSDNMKWSALVNDTSKKARQNNVPAGFPEVPRARIERATPGFSDLCSTN